MTKILQLCNDRIPPARAGRKRAPKRKPCGGQIRTRVRREIWGLSRTYEADVGEHELMFACGTKRTKLDACMWSAFLTPNWTFCSLAPDLRNLRKCAMLRWSVGLSHRRFGHVCRQGH